mmetsp:Transcript_22374/g.29262  ORF Transcript_22374/g.29262 Transcript_22374/m.29262 type:complete len:397 (+) Transcript_22374:105-1295(+)
MPINNSSQGNGRAAEQKKTPAIKYKADIERGVVITTYERNGWVRTEGDDWTIGWFNVGNIRAMFHPDSAVRLTDQQMVNHYPNHWELTRKDTMVKNIKRYMRDTKDGSEADNSQVTGTGEYTFKDGYIPVTYNLPADYNIFVEEFKRNPSAMWIMKPTNMAQGKGIFIINKLSQLKKWANNKTGSNVPRASYIISRYIENPLLVGGKKFDLRLYVLVTSFRPLRAYLSLHGFARFCNVKYSSDAAELDNPYIHLTNVAIQKHNDDYNNVHGGKWHIRDLRLYLESTRGAEATERLFSKMNQLIVHSLLACQDVMINDRHCFECYGYDLLIDDDLKPWLVEVNASPSLSPSTKSDRSMKLSLLRDIYRIGQHHYTHNIYIYITSCLRSSSLCVVVCV